MHIPVWGLFAIALASHTAAAAKPARPGPVPIVIQSGDLDPCSSGLVFGLNARGDGFLSVRAAPTSQAREKDRLFNGRKVFTCAVRGDWIGIVYGQDDETCNVTSPWPRSLAYSGPCQWGWVHRRWIEIQAG